MIIGWGEQLCLKVIVICLKLQDCYVEVIKCVFLLVFDSVYGEFYGMVEVSVDGNELIVNGNCICFIFVGLLGEIDYIIYGINEVVLVDNIGVWCDCAGLLEYFCLGIVQVLFIVLGKGDILNIVYGVNIFEEYENEQVFSVVFCIINVIVLIIDVVEKVFGIE